MKCYSHNNGFKFEKNFIAKYPEPVYMQDPNPAEPANYRL
jgi:hypothetical protein